MKLDVPYKFLDIKPSTELLEFDFSQITTANWEDNQIIRKTAPHLFGEIFSFPILRFHPMYWDEPLKNPTTPINTQHPVWSLINAEIKKLEELYDATAKIAVLDGMPPGARIYPHVDKSNIYGVCHRIHLPLVTHPDVYFYIDTEPHHFEAGQFFEFDNRRVHEVYNGSTDVFRIHLVVDLLPNNLYSKQTS